MKIDLSKVVKAAVKQGWTVEKTNKSQYRFIPADKSKAIVIASATPSCSFALKHIMGDLKRSGFKA
jgi:ribosomal protein L30E